MPPSVNASSVSAPQNPKRAARVAFGDVLNFSTTRLKEWTVTGIDPKSGRVIVSKRLGDTVENRSIPFSEYQQAKTESKKIKNRFKKPSFRLGQSFHLGRNSLRVEGYDGASSSALVEGMVDGKRIRRWVKQQDLNKAASSLAPQVIQKVFEAVGKEKPNKPIEPKSIAEIRTALRERRLAKKQQEVSENMPAQDALYDGIQAEKEAVDARIDALSKRVSVPAVPEVETSEERALAENELKTTTLYKTLLDTDAEIASVEQVDPEAFRATTQKRAEMKEAYQQSLEETKVAAKAANIPAARIESIEKDLQVNKPLLDISSQVVELKASKFELQKQTKGAQASPELTREIKKLDQKLDKIMRAGSSSVQTHLSGTAEATLATKVTGRVVSPKVGIEVEARGQISGNAPQRAQKGSAKAVGTIATAAASAVAGTIVAHQAQTLARAQSALGAINTQIQSREASLQQTRGQVADLARNYQTKNTQQKAATREGRTEEAVTLSGELQTIDANRRELQDTQLNTQAELVKLKSTAQNLRVGINNVEQSEGQTPLALLENLEKAIPPEIARTKPTAPVTAPQTLAEPKPVHARSFSSTLPALATQRRATSGQVTRQRLTKQLGTPFTSATAVSLNVGQQSARRDPSQGGSDAYERALSQEGGLQQASLPSYTMGGPGEDEVEKEDLFESDLAKQRQVREREAQQRATKESLFPEEAQVQPSQRFADQEPIPNEGRSEMSVKEALREPVPIGAPPSMPMEVARARQLQAAQTRARSSVATELVSAVGNEGASGIAANAQAIKKMAKTYKAIKAGASFTLVGIVITWVMANVQLIGGRILNLRIVPKQTIIEDTATVVFDIMLVINMLISAVILFAIPAAIIAIIGGAMWYLSGVL